MLRDNLVGLIEPMLSGAGAYPLALRTNRKQSSDDRPACLENPRPAGAESTLTENVASPFHAEQGQGRVLFTAYPSQWLLRTWIARIQSSRTDCFVANGLKIVYLKYSTYKGKPIS